MANTTRFEQNQELPILLEKESVEFIIQKLNDLKEIEFFNFTENEDDLGDEDRMSHALCYIQCENMINYLKEKLD
jgi:hypothetical protein